MKPHTYLPTYTLHKLAGYGGVIAVCFEWMALILFYIHSPSDFAKQKAISYFSSMPATHFIFAVCLSIAATSFWLFIKWHVTKYFKTPVKLFAISMLCYFALAVIPFIPDNAISYNLHNLLTFGFTFTFILGMYLMGIKNENKKLKLYSFLTAVPATILYIILISLPDKTYFFPIEAAIGFLCQIWSIAINLHLYKRSLP